MAATLALGLAADVAVDLPGQLLIGAAFWGVFFHVCRGVETRDRQALVACLAIATSAELLLSLGWGLYTYRLGNVPMFVPPGHVLMYLLGTALARRVSGAVAGWVALLAAAYAAGAALAGADTLGFLLLLLLALVWFTRPAERRIVASTLVLALGLELYGTALGTWTWHREVPYTALVTTNPPGLSGALYGTLDALVAVAFSCLVRRSAEWLQPEPTRS